MLRTLLTERFQLSIRGETKERRVYALVVDGGGPKIHPTKDGEGSAAKSAVAGGRNFHGTLHQFANLLSVQLSIPAIADPGRPSIASASPVPVLDRTGLEGIYDFNVDFKPEADSDMFPLWQRVLKDRLGLKLESQKAKAEFLVVESALRVPIAN
jgi:uncharacterized protein (TIGR03435 family)